VLKAALTGGMAAGKSTVSACLRTCGVPVSDADRLARDAVAPGTAGLAAVAREFGDGMLRADGSLDRVALAAVVFRDADARRRLEAIIHPLVRAASEAFETACRRAGRRAAVFDIPLLVEAGRSADFDLVVTVSAPEGVRMARAVARGLTETQAWARIRAQATDAEREAAADLTLDGSGTVADLEAQVVARLLPLVSDGAT
jgi:dephospho-CoA kinase